MDNPYYELSPVISFMRRSGNGLSSHIKSHKDLLHSIIPRMCKTPARKITDFHFSKPGIYIKATCSCRHIGFLLFCRSGLEQDDMRILYKYLTTSLFPRHTEPEVWSFSLCGALFTQTHTQEYKHTWN